METNGGMVEKSSVHDLQSKLKAANTPVSSLFVLACIFAHVHAAPLLLSWPTIQSLAKTRPVCARSLQEAQAYCQSDGD